MNFLNKVTYRRFFLIFGLMVNYGVSLAAQQEDSQLQVEVFQPMSTRVEEVLKALAGYSGLMVLFWLLQWVIISWRTEHGVGRVKSTL